MSRRLYQVPVTIADERLVTVRAANARDARERVSRGRYLRLGRSVTRGFLLVGEPKEVDR